VEASGMKRKPTKAKIARIKREIQEFKDAIQSHETIISDLQEHIELLENDLLMELLQEEG